MSMPVNIIAALCAKANDAAFANEISIATGRFAGNTRSKHDDNNEFVASLCAKASAFHLDERRGSQGGAPPTPRTPRSRPPPQVSQDTGDCSDAASVSTTGHNICELQQQELIAFAQSIVTSPEGGEGKQKVSFPFPRTILTPQTSLDEASTTSSLTDVVDRKKLTPKQILDSVSTDELLHALGKKLSSALTTNDKNLKTKIDRLVSEEVASALADVLATKKVAKDPEGRSRGRNSVERQPAKKQPPRGSLKKRSNSRRNLASPTSKGDSLGSFFTANSPTAIADDDNSFDLSSRNLTHAGTRSHDDFCVPSDEDLLAIGWKKAWDSGSDRYYYYTLSRSKVVWDNPLNDWFSKRSEENWFATNKFDGQDDNDDDDDDNPFEVNPFPTSNPFKASDRTK